MSVFSIAKENQELFSRLVPDYLISDLENGTRFALGAVGGEPPDSYVSGVLIFDVVLGSDGEEDYVFAEIKWLYVAEAHRNEGTADDLMSEFLSIAHDADVLHILCDLPFSEEYDLLCAYLEAWGFEFQIQNLYELSVPVSTLCSHPLFVGKPSDKVVALSAVSDLALRNFIDEVSLLPGVLIELTADRRQYDCHVSCAYMINGVPVGGLLVRYNGANGLELLLMRSPGGKPEIFISMLRYSVQAAGRLYPPETMVRIACRTEAFGDLIDKLFPDAEPPIIRRGYFGIDTITEG